MLLCKHLVKDGQLEGRVVIDAIGHHEAALVVLRLCLGQNITFQLLHLLRAENAAEQHDADTRIVVAEQQPHTESVLERGNNAACFHVGETVGGGVGRMADDGFLLSRHDLADDNLVVVLFTGAG